MSPLCEGAKEDRKKSNTLAVCSKSRHRSFLIRKKQHAASQRTLRLDSVRLEKRRGGGDAKNHQVASVGSNESHSYPASLAGDGP